MSEEKSPRMPFWKRCLWHIRLILIVAVVTLFISRVLIPVALNFRHNVLTDLLNNDMTAAAKVPLEVLILDRVHLAEFFDDPEHKTPPMSRKDFIDNPHELFIVIKLTPQEGLKFGTVAIQQYHGRIQYIDIPAQKPSDKPIFIATPAYNGYSDRFGIGNGPLPKVWWRNFYPLDVKS